MNNDWINTIKKTLKALLPIGQKFLFSKDFKVSDQEIENIEKALFPIIRDQVLKNKVLIQNLPAIILAKTIEIEKELGLDSHTKIGVLTFSNPQTNDEIFLQFQAMHYNSDFTEAEVEVITTVRLSEQINKGIYVAKDAKSLKEMGKMLVDRVFSIKEKELSQESPKPLQLETIRNGESAD